MRASVAAMAVGLSLAAAPAAADCLRIAEHAEAVYGIPSPVLQAIILTESGGNPNALNIEGVSVLPPDRHGAMQALRLRLKGNVDVGCGQISMTYHAEEFANQPQMALDPLENVAVSAELLLRNFRTYGTWTKAVAHYHSGNADRQAVYVCKVVKNMARITKSPLQAGDKCGK